MYTHTNHFTKVIKTFSHKNIILETVFFSYRSNSSKIDKIIYYTYSYRRMYNVYANGVDENILRFMDVFS